MHNPTDRITHTTAFVKPVVEHWLEREIAQWVHPMNDRSDDPSHHERTLRWMMYLATAKRALYVRQTSLLMLCKLVKCVDIGGERMYFITRIGMQIKQMKKTNMCFNYGNNTSYL